jgi:hypothetical protein
MCTVSPTNIGKELPRSHLTHDTHGVCALPLVTLTGRSLV